MFLDAGGHGEHVRVENDVLGRETDLLDQDAIGSAADLHPALVVVCLPLFVKGHDHRCRSVAADQRGLPFELLLAHLERNGIHDALALHAAPIRPQ